ncbi:tRNA 4-thiouridine(8) synthase ThiI, partial [Streptococcus salivarius]|nr:tRNA 4-thiouridine(8) synthase ThiI [Streptococcus salivarius]
VVKIPVLRPVLCLDKLEIIDIADRIDTYEISIRPHEDCCTIFTPKAPATKPKLYKAEIFESGFDFETLIDECVETA